MATDAQRAVAGLAVIMAAASMALPLIAKREGIELVGYPDPANPKLATTCVGHTGADAVIGKRYTVQQCMTLLAADSIKAGVSIDTCLPADIPLPMRAAFTSTALNIGGGAFCGSSMSRRALAHDYKGACAALSLWIKAGGRVMGGLVAGRKDDLALCERGL